MAGLVDFGSGRAKLPGDIAVSSHYHAVRVLCAWACVGAEIIASDVTRDMIVERGEHDLDSEIGRFQRLLKGLDKPNIWTAERDIERWRALENKAAASGEVAG